MKQYSKVRLITNKYVNQGAKMFDTGYIIEIYNGCKYEVEFADPKTGINYATIVAEEIDLEVVE